MITRFMQFGYPMEAVDLFFNMVLSMYWIDLHLAELFQLVQS